MACLLGGGLLVCLDYSKSSLWISRKRGERNGRGPREKSLNLGADPHKGAVVR